jgi:KaiC/GvpD/RAD55 family RecA-like ATPase
MADLIPTGVEGLDSVLNGGILRRSAVLVSGNPGSGKSILGQQFVYEGAATHGENGLYLSFEESQEEIALTAESVSMTEWNDLVASGDIDVFGKRDLLRENDITDSVDVVLQAIDEGDYDRLVVDSLTIFGLFFDGKRKRRQYLLKFIDILKQNDITSIMIHEQSATFPKVNIGLENYVTDGNIYLAQVPTSASRSRYVWVAKMRRQNVQSDVFPMEIDDDGLTVYDSASSFSLLNGEWGPQE